MPATTIQELNEDVLVRILSFSDVYSVLSVSQLNRYLRTIALVKQLWILLITSLVNRGLLELSPNIDLKDQSTPELIDQVKRAVSGPRSWIPSDEPSPTPSTTLTVPAKINPYGNSGDWRVKLLNGGRHIVVVDRATVKIWDVRTQRCIWTRSVYVVSFGADRGQPSDKIALAMMLNDRVTLEIVQLDTRLEEAEVFSFRVPLFTALVDPVISGNLVVVYLNRLGCSTLLIDWRARTYVPIGDSSDYSLDFIPGSYVVVVAPDPYSQLPPQYPDVFIPRPLTQVLLYSLGSFAPYWRPITNSSPSVHEPITLAALVPLVVETPEFDARQFRDGLNRLSVLESPIQSGTFLVQIHLYDGSVQNPLHRRAMGIAAIFSYIVRRAELHGWRRCSARAAVPGLIFHELSYAGHGVDDAWKTVYSTDAVPDYAPGVPPFPSQVLKPPLFCRWQDLSPYSGVVTTLTDKEVIVSYYL
ncbi:hypothetical protein DFH09DRAFT_1190509 [Mycena vulgaris]|nr:hypothetical protein DFH09DRAFT_1190509 [Mycena vulgaris]